MRRKTERRLGEQNEGKGTILFSGGANWEPSFAGWTQISRTSSKIIAIFVLRRSDYSYLTKTYLLD